MRAPLDAWDSWDATAVAAHVRSGSVTAREVTEHVLELLERNDPVINSHTLIRRDQALAEATQIDDALARGEDPGPLCGVPVSVKDIIWSAGDVSTSGSLATKDFVADVDADVVARVRAAGAVIVGKTNNSEFCFRGVADNQLFGPTLNPWNLGRTAGGSSGGAAAAVAAHLEPLALGSDGGGSVRMPSSFCGVAGLKPSHGRIPGTPGFRGWGSLADNGLIAHTVRDLQLALGVVEEPHWTARELIAREGRPAGSSARLTASVDLGYAPVDDEVREVFWTQIEALRAAGWTIDEVDPPGGDPLEPWTVIAAAEGFAAYREVLEQHRALLEPATVRMLEAGRPILAADYVDALQWRADYCQLWTTFYQRYDAVLCPSTQQPAFEVGLDQPALINGAEFDFPAMGWAALCLPGNVTGQPAVSVPGGMTRSDLPVGLQVIGPADTDQYTMEIAAALERIIGPATLGAPTTAAGSN